MLREHSVAMRMKSAAWRVTSVSQRVMPVQLRGDSYVAARVIFHPEDELCSSDDDTEYSVDDICTVHSSTGKALCSESDISSL
jgi:hypothetical protein